VATVVGATASTLYVWAFTGSALPAASTEKNLRTVVPLRPSGTL
jgi:hypothetical protein